MNSGYTVRIDQSAANFGSGGDSSGADGVEKMFLEYYGLAEQPFGVTPDPRFLYLGSKHRQALAALDYGTNTGRGFLALVAKPGMGKTSLLFQYLEGLRDKARTALVFQTDGDSRDLMRYLLADLGLDGKGKDLPEMRSMLNEVLLEEMRAGRRFILVIDEAQNLSEKALESVRLLSNFETPRAKLMQIVLAGQPQLAERLASTSLAQLRQRISFFIKIEPFTREEAGAYIDHRLWVAGYRGPQMFTADARRSIAEHSEGVPRMINNICFGAMSLGWALKRIMIDQEMIGDVLAELSTGPQKERAAAVSQAKPEIESKHAALQIFRPINQEPPMRGWLPRLVAGGALLLVLSWWVVRLSIGKTRASGTGSRTLVAAPVAADSRKTLQPDMIVIGPNSVESIDESGSGDFQPSAVRSFVSSKKASDPPVSLIRRYSTQVGAQIRWFFRSLARFRQTFGNAS
jgi:type II secretory pathway predicted ATPase ExeA